MHKTGCSPAESGREREEGEKEGERERRGRERRGEGIRVIKTTKR